MADTMEMGTAAEEAMQQEYMRQLKATFEKLPNDIELLFFTDPRHAHPVDGSLDDETVRPRKLLKLFSHLIAGFDMGLLDGMAAFAEELFHRFDEAVGELALGEALVFLVQVDDKDV